MGDGPAPVVIVGAGIAGLKAAEAMRRAGVERPIVLLGDESHPPYNRPGLTKRAYLRGTSLEEAMTSDLRVRGSDTDSVEWRLGTTVRQADLAQRTVTLSDGVVLDYRCLVIASGTRGRRLRRDSGGLTLRGIDDARLVHDRLRAGARVVVTGTGFIGCEMTSLAVAYGCDVEVSGGQPFERLLGPAVGESLRSWAERRGVTFAPPAGSSHLTAGDDAASSDTLYVEAIGSVPNVEWLDGNGLELSDGVRVDERMVVTGHADVVAAGDVARYPDPWNGGELTRGELWKPAIDTGRIAGRSVAAHLGSAVESVLRPPQPPTTSTDFLGLRIQVAGAPRRADRVEVVAGDLQRPAQGALLGYRRSDELVGVGYIDGGAAFASGYRELVACLTLRSKG